MYPGITIGIKENERNGFGIFPNPSKGTFTVTDQEITGKVMIQVFTVDGLEVYRNGYEGLNKSFKENIDLRNLAKGVYMIRLTTTTSVKSGKLVFY